MENVEFRGEQGPPMVGPARGQAHSDNIAFSAYTVPSWGAVLAPKTGGALRPLQREPQAGIEDELGLVDRTRSRKELSAWLCSGPKDPLSGV